MGWTFTDVTGRTIIRDGEAVVESVAWADVPPCDCGTGTLSALVGFRHFATCQRQAWLEGKDVAVKP